MRWLPALLALAACDASPKPQRSDTPGARLEAAAVKAGLVVDPAMTTLIGSWAREGDRMCVMGQNGSEQRIGIVVDYGPGQGCSAAGTLRRSGERIRIDLGDCRFEARFDGERIAFPAGMPAECQALCTGRASLAALEVERLSMSASEAATLRGRGGRPLCVT